MGLNGEDDKVGKKQGTPIKFGNTSNSVGSYNYTNNSIYQGGSYLTQQSQGGYNSLYNFPPYGTSGGNSYKPNLAANIYKAKGDSINLETVKTTVPDTNGGFKGLSDGQNAAAGAASAVGMAAIQVGGAAAVSKGKKMMEEGGIDESNIDTEVDQAKTTKGAQWSTAGDYAMKGATLGAAVGTAIPIPIVGPLIGAAAGALIGGTIGFFKGRSDGTRLGKEQEAARKKKVKTRNIGRMYDDQNALITKSAQLQQAGVARYGSKQKGGKFENTDTLLIDTTPFVRAVYHASYNDTDVKIFKKGGKITDENNIVPNGVSHEEKNDLGTKGMPVVKCKKDSCSKVYEIESDELIFTYKNTKKIEELSQDDNFEKLGEFVLEQLKDNTHSYSNNYKFLNADESILDEITG